TQAYFFARSGAEIARQYSSKADLADKIHILYGNLPGANEDASFSFSIQDNTGEWKTGVREKLEAFRKQDGLADKEIVVAVWKEGQTTKILSLGTAADATRVVSFEGTSATSAEQVINMALYAAGMITIGNSANYSIIGKVGTAEGTIVNYDPDKDKVDKIPDGVVYNLDVEYKLPPFPSFPDLTSRGSLNVQNNQTISADGYYTSLTVGNNKTLYIDTGGKDTVRKIVVDTLALSGGSIVLTGEGELELYVRAFSGSPSGSINEVSNADPGRVTLYTPVQSINLENLDMAGTIYIESPTGGVVLGSGNKGMKIHGLIIVGGNSNISASGSSVSGGSIKSVLYAPNSTVNMSGTSAFYGAIVAKELTTSGGGSSGGIVYMIDGLGDTLDPIVEVNASELWGE
ncbi:MAG TPA: hypothetical protein PK396_13400, partial [Mesotoga sp.]|nr:hypothetical protein [Mesotoga sp.]